MTDTTAWEKSIAMSSQAKKENRPRYLRKIVWLFLLLTVAFDARARAEKRSDPEQWIHEAEAALDQV